MAFLVRVHLSHTVNEVVGGGGRNSVSALNVDPLCRLDGGTVQYSTVTDFLMYSVSQALRYNMTYSSCCLWELFMPRLYKKSELTRQNDRGTVAENIIRDVGKALSVMNKGKMDEKDTPSKPCDRNMSYSMSSEQRR
ncbi:uncharacterized protein UTRI_03676 [Ustilago trichophora]|uniref:Uncharacterized protein n=1 Tax=Ustilago trichophora TaxID=86804 RepID=A0A5C3E1T2_9BASI|nr:uncharacterized protein UTRI_03676 [Ustilago trichophora]